MLKEDVAEAEKWIGNQQSTVKNNISSVDKAESDTRKALESTGTFSSAEIESQVEGIRKKKALLEKNWNELEAIKGRAADIYKQGSSAID